MGVQALGHRLAKPAAALGDVSAGLSAVLRPS